jgi:hypothetical protein
MRRRGARINARRRIRKRLLGTDLVLGVCTQGPFVVPGENLKSPINPSEASRRPRRPLPMRSGRPQQHEYRVQDPVPVMYPPHDAQSSCGGDPFVLRGDPAAQVRTTSRPQGPTAPCPASRGPGTREQRSDQIGPNWADRSGGRQKQCLLGAEHPTHAAEGPARGWAAVSGT